MTKQIHVTAVNSIKKKYLENANKIFMGQDPDGKKLWVSNLIIMIRNNKIYETSFLISLIFRLPKIIILNATKQNKIAKTQLYTQSLTETHLRSCLKLETNRIIVRKKIGTFFALTQLKLLFWTSFAGCQIVLFSQIVQVAIFPAFEWYGKETKKRNSSKVQLQYKDSKENAEMDQKRPVF